VDLAAYAGDPATVDLAAHAGDLATLVVPQAGKVLLRLR
jgi:hypothetical protein